MKVVYFAMAGSADPNRASIPYHLAVNGSAEIGHEVEVVLGGDATDVLVGDTIDKVEGLGVPPLRQLVDKLLTLGIPVHVCKNCAISRGVTEEDLPKVNGAFTTPTDAARLLAEADKALTF